MNNWQLWLVLMHCIHAASNRNLDKHLKMLLARKPTGIDAKIVFDSGVFENFDSATFSILGFTVLSSNRIVRLQSHPTIEAKETRMCI